VQAPDLPEKQASHKQIKEDDQAPRQSQADQASPAIASSAHKSPRHQRGRQMKQKLLSANQPLKDAHYYNSQ